MLNERDGPNLNAPSGDQPALVRLSEVVTETEDPVQAAKFADLFLLCMAAAGTVLGSLVGSFLYLALFGGQHAPTLGWMIALLASVAFGGTCGCAIVMFILHAKDLIRFERRNEVCEARQHTSVS
jgi:MFS family permease